VLVGGDEPPFRAVVGLLRRYLEPRNRAIIDGRLILAGHPGNGRGVTFPGLPLRSVLLATYAVFRENRSEEELEELDIDLGLREADEDDEMPEHGSTFGSVIQGDFGQVGDVITVA
jgi:hypothetical protein